MSMRTAGGTPFHAPDIVIGDDIIKGRREVLPILPPPFGKIRIRIREGYMVVVSVRGLDRITSHKVQEVDGHWELLPAHAMNVFQK